MVIGAPYEDEGGSVYVYTGSPRGISTQHTQRIFAAQFTSINPSGFGYSITAGTDVDGNRCDGTWYKVTRTNEQLQIFLQNLYPISGVWYFNNSDSFLISDVVIGAYASDQVLLLLSRPVININVETELQEICANPENQECQTTSGVTYPCFSFTINFSWDSYQPAALAQQHGGYTFTSSLGNTSRSQT